MNAEQRANERGIEYLSKDDAQKFVNKKLDGRFKYYIWEGQLCTTGRMTVSCSGCNETDGYGTYQSFGGCHECGYTGKRVCEFPAPVLLCDLEPLTPKAL